VGFRPRLASGAMSAFWHPFAEMAKVQHAPFIVDRGEGIYVFDEEGRRYLDAAASLWYMNVGYGRDEIIDAMAEQMRKLAAFHAFIDYGTRPPIDLANRIAAVSPDPGSKVFFGSGGSDAVDTAAKALAAAKAGQVDLVIMDVGLPDLDGREAVRILRKNGFKAPIIMLTGHDTDSDTILGLESGANDYVTKPFRFAVLLARIRAQLRQHEASEDAVFSIGPYTFRPSSKLLISPKGSKIRLTEKETAILRYLYRAGQRPISRETLLQEVWGYNSGVTTHTLETHVYRLRQKLEKDAAHPAILVTDAGGYKLVP